MQFTSWSSGLSFVVTFCLVWILVKFQTYRQTDSQTVRHTDKIQCTWAHHAYAQVGSKIRATIRPVLLKQGEPGMPQYLAWQVDLTQHSSIVMVSKFTDNLVSRQASLVSRLGCHALLKHKFLVSIAGIFWDKNSKMHHFDRNWYYALKVDKTMVENIFVRHIRSVWFRWANH